MKKLITLGLFLFAANMISANNLIAIPTFSASIVGSDKILADQDLVLNLVTENSHRLLRVSFNGKEGTDGVLKVYNSNHELKAEFNFELIKFPNYATVDLTDLPAGNYTVELSTKVAIHTATLPIQ